MPQRSLPVLFMISLNQQDDDDDDDEDNDDDDDDYDGALLFAGSCHGRQLWLYAPLIVDGAVDTLGPLVHPIDRPLQLLPFRFKLESELILEEKVIHNSLEI